MKKDIHPKYYKDAVIHCACGKVFKMGATKPEIHIEICSACHPLYTGQDKVIDAAGRVEKFKKRLEKTAEKKKSRGKK